MKYFFILNKKVRIPKDIICINEELGVFADHCVRQYQPSKEEAEQLHKSGHVIIVLKSSKKKMPAEAFPIHITQLFKQRTIRLIASKGKAEGLVSAEVENIDADEQTRLVKEHYRNKPEETILDINWLLKSHYNGQLPNQINSDLKGRHRKMS